MKSVTPTTGNTPATDGHPVRAETALGTRAIAPLPASLQFNAALQRAAARTPSRHEEDAESDQTAPQATWSAPGARAAQASADAATAPMDAGGTAAPPPSTQPMQGLAVAVPLATRTLNAIGKQTQWQVKVPAKGHTLAMNLTHSGAGQWLLRLSTDTQTRQHLEPRVPQLRAKLQQHAGNARIDLDLADDASSA